MIVELRFVLKTLLWAQALLVGFAPHSWARDFFGIADYRPSTFIEAPSGPFFYSVGNKLRFGSVLADDGPILFEAKSSDRGIWAVYVSPDETKAAVASGGNLYLVQPGQSPVLLVREAYNLMAWGSNAHMKGPVNKLIYDYGQLQWDASSQFLYIPQGVWRDRYPSHMALLRIDIGNPTDVIEIAEDASGLNMFSVGSNTVCFKRVVNKGDLIWRCTTGDIERSPKAIEADRIVMDDGTSVDGKPFASFRGSSGEIWLIAAGFSIRAYNGRWGFFSKDRPDEPIFQFNGGVEWLKGHYGDGIYTVRCSVLPGGRYAFLELLMENFKGGRAQIVVDGATGQYREVPRDSLVYRNLNSFNYDNVKFGLKPLDSPEFELTRQLRPYKQ
jgi:hypothetical protein